jgi:excinuclease UvrABC nuclease subunit
VGAHVFELQKTWTINSKKKSIYPLKVQIQVPTKGETWKLPKAAIKNIKIQIQNRDNILQSHATNAQFITSKNFSISARPIRFNI